MKSDTAQRGVQARLVGATLCLATTLLCVASIALGGTTVGLVAGFSIGFCTFNAGIALLLSARREESLHMLANEAPAGLLGSEPEGTDGSI